MPGQTGVKESGFESLRSEALPRAHPRRLVLTAHAEDYHVKYNTIRPHEALAWNRPFTVHLGCADRAIPNFDRTESLPTA